jgi:hypothetical protein
MAPGSSDLTSFTVDVEYDYDLSPTPSETEAILSWDDTASWDDMGTEDSQLVMNEANLNVLCSALMIIIIHY